MADRTIDQLYTDNPIAPTVGTTKIPAMKSGAAGAFDVGDIDGDQLDIDFTPSNYTPSTAPAEASDVDDLAAHLAGIDNKLAAIDDGTSNQVAITANGESVIVDNDAATPSFRPDADNTWCLGEDATRWKCIAGGPGSAAEPTLNLRENTVGLYSPAPSQLAVATDGAQVANFEGTLDAATGNEVSVSLTPTINKATSGNYTALEVDVTETAAPGTDDRLLDLKVGGTSQTYVTNGGAIVTQAGSVSAPTLAVRDTATGVYSPATNELALVANGEYVAIDNASATPSLRPDVTSTWDFGESALRWKCGYFSCIDITSATEIQLTVSDGTNSLVIQEDKIQRDTTGSFEQMTILTTAGASGTAYSGCDIVVQAADGAPGTGGAAAGSGGDVFFDAGDAGADGGAGGGNGGFAYIRAGAASGGGSAGSILIGQSNAATIEMARDGYPLEMAGFIRFAEQTSDPSSATNKGSLYTKNDGSQTQLYWRNEGGDIVLMTDAGEGTAITGTTHSTDTTNDQRPRDCSNAAGCTITVNTAYAGCVLGPYFASTASQTVSFSDGTASLVHLDATLTSTSRGQNAWVWIYYLSDSTYRLLGELATV